ncbi:MAG: radical SAM protein, partial [Firmicutes bacterium]|nr:radical SAM protein [Bacillota bacterium]
RERNSSVGHVVLATLNAKYVHSSLALRCLRAAIRDVHDASLMEFTIHDPLDYVAGSIFEQSPDVIGLSCYIWNIEETARLVPVLRAVLPHALIVLGGPEVSYDPEFFMGRLTGVDLIVLGEGESTLREVLEAHGHGQGFAEIPGLCYRGGGGALHRTVSRAKAATLDDFPSPYPDEHMGELQNRIVYFEASRGCPFSCQFCLSSIESGVRYASLERVLDDLRRLIRSGVRQIKFVDRTFNLRKEYALKIFEFLIADPGETTFHFEITADILKPEVVAWLGEHAPPGLFRFEIGVQSTSDLTNSLVERRQDFLRLSKTVTTLRESGVIVQHLDLIAGLPEEDYAGFARTFNDVYALAPDELQLGFLKMLRGTGLRRLAARFGYEYMESAPYEILRSSVLSYQDILRLKRLEDILEKYYNSGRFPHVLRYVTGTLFDSPFAFYQAFGDFWAQRGWSRIGHQPADLVRRLEQFLQVSGLLTETVAALLHGDYLFGEKMRPRTIWWGAQRLRRDERLDPAWLEPVPVDVRPNEDIALRAVTDRIPVTAWRQLAGLDALGTEGEPNQAVTVCYLYPRSTGRPTLFQLDRARERVERSASIDAADEAIRANGVY